MIEVLDIGAVAAATGLSQRALRFYEARGLVRPLRLANGRRVYGRGELARLHAVVALKSAGFSLAEIGRTLAGRHPDLARLVAAQIADLNRRQATLAQARALLGTVQSRIDRGEPIDVATLCSLIRTGDDRMERENWQAVTDRYFSPEDKAAFGAAQAALPPGFDPEAYATQWKELGARLQAALPLDPAGATAQAFVDEWFALLKPFSAVATPAMWSKTAALYADRANWPAPADPGFSAEAWQLIQDAIRHRRANGGTIDGPAWMAGPAAG